MPKTPQVPANKPNEVSGLSASSLSAWLLSAAPSVLPLSLSVLTSPLGGAPPPPPAPWLLDVCPLPPMTTL